MNLRKRVRNFFTLTRGQDDGFTLVELIVVIAIMAILGGVAVPAYSGYIDRSNKAADQTLIRDVKQALELYAYSNPNSVDGIGVILNQEGTAPVAVGDVAQVQEALAAVFGEDANIGLKYADWKGDSSPTSYRQSSYYGKESDLISTVDKLTGALGDVVKEQESLGNTLIGGEFNDFLKANKINTDDGKAIGNAAVLYVANKTQGKETEIENAFLTGITASNGNAAAAVNNVYANLYATGIGEAASLAAIYAYAEGYAQATGKADEFHTNTKFENVKDATSALTALGNAFSVLDPNGFATYAGEQGKKDLQGYIDMMGTVNNNKDIVSNNLNSADCFTDGIVETMLKGHAKLADLGGDTEDQQVAVIVYIEDGVIRSHVTPMNWNK